jgi:RNA polymerase sigma-70 factor (ECF subfamily)
MEHWDPRTKEDFIRGMEEKAYDETLRNCLMSKGAHHQDLDDLTQDAYMRAYKYFDLYEPGTNFKAWLCTVGQRNMINHHRRRLIKPEDFSLDAENEDGSTMKDGLYGHHTPETDLEMMEEFSYRPIIRRAISDLPHQWKMILLSTDIEGLGRKETAELMGLPQGTVLSSIYRAKNRILDCLVAASEAVATAASDEEAAKTLAAEYGIRGVALERRVYDAVKRARRVEETTEQAA